MKLALAGEWTGGFCWVGQVVPTRTRREAKASPYISNGNVFVGRPFMVAEYISMATAEDGFETRPYLNEKEVLNGIQRP